jgi:lambda family phage minor tail protein L
MVSIARELNSLAPDAIVTLFEFDISPILETPTGSDSVFYTNTNVGNNSYIPWGGENYLPFPFEFTGVESKGDGTALARPMLTVSNVNKVFFAIFLTFGDLSGVAVRRTVTAFKYTDGQPEADILATLSVNEYVVVKKVKQDKLSIQYELGSSLDRPGLKLPRRVILRDATINNLHAPGVSRVRLRG